MNGEVRIREDHEMKKAILAIACITVAATLSMTIQSFAEDGAAKPMHVMLPPDVIQCRTLQAKLARVTRFRVNRFTCFVVLASNRTTH